MPSSVDNQNQNENGNENLHSGLSVSQPIPVPLRHEMEVAFNTDFSRVRIHSGHNAAALGALAYTQGNNIYLQPDPHGMSHPDPKLLAHELAHIVQQRAPGQVPTPQRTFKPVP